MTLRERLLAKAHPIPAGCWEWRGAKTASGYGRVAVGGNNRFAHRVSYQEFKGDIGTGLYVLHTCDNRACINPAHLTTGTQRDNIQDCVKRGRRANQKGTANNNYKHGRRVS